MVKLRGRLSFANVVSVVALFVALGGSAYAVGAGTVGTKQLKDDAVTSQKVDNGTLGTRDLNTEILTSDEVTIHAGCDTPPPGFLQQGGSCQAQLYSGNGLEVNLECEVPNEEGGAILLTELSISGAQSATINGEKINSTSFDNGETLGLFATSGSGGSLSGTLQMEATDYNAQGFCSATGVLIGG